MGVRFTDGSPEQLFHVLERKHHAAVDNLLSRNGLSNIGQPAILSILSQQETASLRLRRSWHGGYGCLRLP